LVDAVQRRKSHPIEIISEEEWISVLLSSPPVTLLHVTVI
jgi:hypothetical protein